MKRIICLIMVCLFALCALTACKKNGPTIMGNDGATYEQVVDKDGNPVTDPSGNPVVIAPKGTDASGNEQEDATQSLTIPYLASSGKTIESPGYRVDIPKDWEMKSSAADPILENKEETLQISIMDKSAVAKNRKEYAETARNSLMQVGNTPSEITETTIAGNSTSKFTSSVQKDDDTKLFSVFYIVENNGKIYVLSGTAKSENEFQSADFDTIFNNSIQFK